MQKLQKKLPKRKALPTPDEQKQYFAENEILFWSPPQKIIKPFEEVQDQVLKKLITSRIRGVVEDQIAKLQEKYELKLNDAFFES